MNEEAIQVSVTYSRTSVPESLMVKGKEVGQRDLCMALDRLIENALKHAGMEWYASGTEMVTDSLVRDIAFDCDLEKILNAPTEQEINSELARVDVVEEDVFVTP